VTPDRIIIHHSATPDGDTYSWGAIEDYHVITRGWKDIGYHAGIEKVRGLLVCMYGRPNWMSGAHTVGQNSRSLGFCFVGCFDESPPPEAVLRVAARRVLVDWCITYGIEPSNIFAHRSFANKTCPGTVFDMDLLRQIVEEELHVATGGHR